MGWMEACTELAQHRAQPLRIISVPRPAVSSRDLGDGGRARGYASLRERMKRKPRVGVVGCGNIAYWVHLPTLNGKTRTIHLNDAIGIQMLAHTQRTGTIAD